MTDNDDAAELEALAANPQTDWDVLHWIAENHPELRPTIAANPGTYQELVDALAALGDPAINAAVALRHRGRDVSSATAATNPLAGMYDTATYTIPAYREGESEPFVTDLTYEPVGPRQAEQARVAQSAWGTEATWGAESAAAESADQGSEFDTGPVYYAQPSEEPAGEPGQSEQEPAEAAGPEEAGVGPGEAASSEPVVPAVAGVPAGQSGSVSQSDSASQGDSGAGEDFSAEDQAALLAAEQVENAGPGAFDDVLHSPDPGGVEPGEPQPAAHGAAAVPAAQPHAVTEEKQRRRAPVGVIAVVLLGIVGIGAAVALLISLLGGEDETPVAEPEPSPTEDEAPAEEDEQGESPQQTEEAADSEDEALATLDEARSAVGALPEDSSCEAGEDTGVVGEFVTAGSAADGFPADEDAELLEETFSQLQSECSSTHAAEVYTAARSSTGYDGDAPEGAQAAMDTVGTEWADRELGLRGAEPMSGFSAQDGNVECLFEDGVTCTVYETSPELCDEGSTYRMTLDGVDLDCDAHLEPDAETLEVDDSATDGFLVCTEMDDRVSCYNSLDPFGFEMSNTGNYAY